MVRAAAGEVRGLAFAGCGVVAVIGSERVMRKLLGTVILCAMSAPGLAQPQDAASEVFSPAVAVITTNKLADYCIYNDRTYSVNAVICVGRNATQRCVRGQRQNDRELPATWSDPVGTIPCER
jgi:hypothetical protein